MNWNNINLNDNYEKDQNIIEPLSFKTLLLEVSCNIKDSEINEATIMQQFETDIQSKINCAREIMQANIKNITTYAISESKESHFEFDENGDNAII